MKRHKQRKEKISAKELFALGANKALNIIRPKPILHVSCKGSVEIEHCKSIIEYTKSSIRLDMDNICAEITGDDLVLDTLLKEKMVIHGRIFGINLIYGKGGGNNA